MPTNPDLAALSAAATQGEWSVHTTHYGKAASIRNSHKMTAESLALLGRENAAFIAALVNAYRTGNLVLIDREGMRERVAEAIAQAMHGKGFCPFTHPETYDLCLQLADAAIAAILEGE